MFYQKGHFIQNLVYDLQEFPMPQQFHSNKKWRDLFYHFLIFQRFDGL